MQSFSKHALRTRPLPVWSVAAAIILLGFGDVGCRAQSIGHLKEVGVCELFKNAPKYQGQLIAVRGVYFFGLRQECSPPLIRSGRVWPYALDAVDSSFAALEKRPVPFVTDRSGWEVLDDAYRREGRKGAREEIWATFVGVLQLQDAEGKKLGGYGHLGAFPAQFVVKEVRKDSIVIVQRPTYQYSYDPKKLHL